MRWNTGSICLTNVANLDRMPANGAVAMVAPGESDRRLDGSGAHSGPGALIANVAPGLSEAPSSIVTRSVRLEWMANMSDPRFPIGKFAFNGPPDETERRRLIDEIEQTPAALRAAVQGLSAQQIETPYRDGGWTVRQVVHHVPESHMNAYIRFKLALTEDSPTIKPYMEDRWAKLADVQSTPLEVSLSLLDALHNRWARLLRSLEAQDWKRTFNHPELGSMPLEKNLALYAWHGRHHVAHIIELRKKMGW